MAVKKPAKKAASKAKPAARSNAAKPAAKSATKAPKGASSAKAARSTKPAAKAARSTKPAAKAARSTKAASKAGPSEVAAPSDQQRAFLADILANPDDKKARIVYADLLQDRGDPRGEFIALQCTRAELPDDDPRCADIDASIAALEKQHRKTWIAALGDNKGAKAKFRRGFIEQFSLDAADLLRNATTIFSTEPIEELSVWKIDESKAKIGKSRLAPVLEAPLDRVRRLVIARVKLLEEDYEAIANAKTLGNVRLLDLTNGGSYMMPVAALAKSTSMPKLEELKLAGCMMGDKQMAELAKSKSLTFTRLVAPRNDLGAAACASIAEAVWAPKLLHLDLSSNEMLHDEGLEALANGNFDSLKSLVLEYCGFYDRGCEIILKSKVFERLEYLDVSSNFSRDDLERIAEKFGARLHVRGMK